ncbi:hypothetical protein ACWDA7_46360 [Streptomyces sp. NPDC001156]
MPESTDRPPEQPSPAPLAPQQNKVLAEPATVEACQRDYAAGGDVRSRLDRQIRGGR